MNCKECSSTLAQAGMGRDSGLICPRDGFEPTIDEQIAGMDRKQYLKDLLQKKKDGVVTAGEYKDAIGI